jgi:hypothetical protein
LAGGFVSPNKINVIEYVTIQTTGNATDFGDLTDTTDRHGGCSNAIRGVFAGGRNSGGDTNTIQYVTIQTTGNALDFGDLSSGIKSYPASCAGT